MAVLSSSQVYSVSYDLPRHIAKPRQTLMLAAIPRTGSTYFGIELWKTGLLGAPFEYTNLANRYHDMIPRLGTGDAIRYWNALQQVRTSPNGIFSFKAFISDLMRISSGEPALLECIEWDAVVYLTRRDKLSQAVSYARAFQTKKWASDQRAVRAPSYQSSLITTALDWIKASENAWFLLFDRHHTSPLRVFYEDVCECSSLEVSRVLEFIDVGGEPRALVNAPSLAVQRDSISVEWMDRYLHDEPTRASAASNGSFLF